MIKQAIVDEAKRLLAEGQLSQRKIAFLLKISRGSVGAIANGKRPDYAARAIANDEQTTLDDGPKVRCLGCGGLVSLPCRACRDREALGSARRLPGEEKSDPDALNVNLHPAERVRYEKIHEQKANGIDQTAGAWEEPCQEDDSTTGPETNGDRRD